MLPLAFHELCTWSLNVFSEYAYDCLGHVQWKPSSQAPCRVLCPVMSPVGLLDGKGIQRQPGHVLFKRLKFFKSTPQNGQFRMIAKDWKPARSLSQTQDFIKVGESGRPDASQIPHGQKICKELSGQNWKATTRTTPTRTQLRWTWKGYCILLFFSNDSTHFGDIHNSWNCSSPRHTNTTTNPASETILCPFNFFCNVRTFEINAPQTISDLSSLISSLRYRMVVGSWAPLSGWTPRPFGLAAFWMLKQIVWTQLANGTGQLAFGSF